VPIYRRLRILGLKVHFQMVIVKTLLKVWLYFQYKSHVLCPTSSGDYRVLLILCYLLLFAVYSPQVPGADHPKHCFHVNKEHVEDLQELSVRN